MPTDRRSAGTYELLFVIGIIAISFSSIFVRWSSADVAVIAMYRLYLTNLLMLPLVWRYRHEWMRLQLRQWGLLIASGVMLALHFLLWMASLRLTTVASSTVILTLEPVFVMLASYVLFRTRVNRMMLIGIGIAMVGSIIIGSGDFALSGDALVGDLLSMLGALAVAIHMMLGKHLRKDMSAFVYNFSVFALAATSLAVYNLVRGIPFFGYEAKEWGVFLLLAIVPTLFGHYLFNWLLKFMNTAAVSMSVLGEPVIASVLAWMLLGEALTIYQLGAGMLILFGVWLFIRHGDKE
ncbi:drug/metabolite transporter (DMT)-like permease [Paenibacillus cellulosilyticus]|uniref:Drug/metabolite transporter (DMT)-like permease n=1 Tax=Paenibacillus cellulosilyticus TaxID=375489 RepID=A0A2V2Z4H7_9BACL|nr:DMT family transporter [Paenibacillus cellulosilyticus]PWW05235.1 drug/metabolite transporter (DMT)-like permease [Paenibacillus cellulosilyticus]QKS43559.1 DMT family transporter [Paenibacillus cellulosilyticus]